MSLKSYYTYQNLKPRSEDIVQPSGSQSSEESEVRSWQPTHIPRIIKQAHQIPQTDESARPLNEASASFQALPHSETENLESMPMPNSQRLKFRLSVGTSDQSITQTVTPTTSVMVFHQPTGTTMQDLPMTETTSNMERYLRSRWLWQLPTGLEEESVSLDAHLRKHICPEPGCKKRFTSPGSLRAHFVVHTGATRESFESFHTVKVYSSTQPFNVHTLDAEKSLT